MSLFFIFLLVIAYLIGSLPVGYIIAKMRGIADIRKHGSGNIGATNVSRALGLHYFFLIFLLDAGKAAAYLYCVMQKVTSLELYALATALLIGNCCSIFLQGTGGKGISTIFGILFVVRPSAVAVVLAVWMGNFLATKNAGISSVISMVGMLGLAVISFDVSFLIWSFFVTCLVVWTHRRNIFSYQSSRIIQI